MVSKPVVVVENLSKKFNGHFANFEINLTVNKGEIIGIAGPDGSGKTTLLRQIAGLIEPSNGKIEIFGSDIKKNYEVIKKKIGYLSQNFSHYSDLTIRENLEFFAEIHGVEDFNERYKFLLSFAKLESFQNTLVSNLSGGMKQKLALICCLIYDPEILLLDEPTTGVDPISRREFWFLLSDLVRRGKTILFSTPYLDEAERFHKVALLNEGKLLACDTPTNLIKEFNSRYEVIEIYGLDYNSIKNLSKSNFEIQLFGDRVNLVISRNEADINEFEASIKKLCLNDVEIIRISPSLENVFFNLLNL